MPPSAFGRPNGQVGAVTPDAEVGADMKSTGPIGSVPVLGIVPGREPLATVAGSTVPAELATYIEDELHLIPAASTEVTESVDFVPGWSPLTRIVSGVSAAETLGLTVSCKPPLVAAADAVPGKPSTQRAVATDKANHLLPGRRLPGCCWLMSRHGCAARLDGTGQPAARPRCSTQRCFASKQHLTDLLALALPFHANTPPELGASAKVPIL